MLYVRLAQCVENDRRFDGRDDHARYDKQASLVQNSVGSDLSMYARNARDLMSVARSIDGVTSTGSDTANRHFSSTGSGLANCHF